VRGHAGDYDHWQAQGASGWSYADILPYFKKMEPALDGEAGLRGRDGRLHILTPIAHRHIFGI
jgi:choline dehydrogenase